MTDFVANAIKLQQQMLDAQTASIEAARAKMEAAGREIAEANLEAMKTWARLWNVWL